MTLNDMLFGSWLAVKMFQLSAILVLVAIFCLAMHYNGVWQKKRRIERLKKKLGRFRKPFVTNTEHSVGAVCLASEFGLEVDIYMNNVGLEKGQNKPWDKVVVCVPRTFTWVPTEALKRPAHSGTKFQFNDIMIDLIEALTNVVVRDMDPDDIGDVVSVLVTQDPRLLVPYASGQGERPHVYERVGSRTIEEARELIMFGLFH